MKNLICAMTLACGLVTGFATPPGAEEIRRVRGISLGVAGQTRHARLGSRARRGGVLVESPCDPAQKHKGACAAGIGKLSDFHIAGFVDHVGDHVIKLS